MRRRLPVRFLTIIVLNLMLLLLVALNRLVTTWRFVVIAEPGTVLYTSTFEDGTDDWDVYPGRLSAEVVDGAMRISVGSPGSAPFSTQSTNFSDFDLRAETRAVDGPLNNGYGVIFRFTEYVNYDLVPEFAYGVLKRPLNLNDRVSRSYYVFFISSDGFYRVVRHINGEETDLSAWIDTPLIRQGIGEINRVRVIAQGDQFTFFINGEQVQVCVPNAQGQQSTYYLNQCVDGEMRDTLVDDTIPSGRLGVVAWTDREAGVVVDFDNVIVYGPAVSPETTEDPEATDEGDYLSPLEATAPPTEPSISLPTLTPSATADG